jgi:hypothetical protein
MDPREMWPEPRNLPATGFTPTLSNVTHLWGWFFYFSRMQNLESFGFVDMDLNECRKYSSARLAHHCSHTVIALCLPLEIFQ